MKSSGSDNRPYILLTEPGLHSSDGHMRGEIEALASGMHSIGINFCVVAWKAPKVPLPDWLDADFVSPRLEKLINTLPSRIGVRLLEFQVYRKAFIAAQNAKNAVVIGLTASGPFGPALAALSVSSHPAALLITRHTGAANQSRHSPWRVSFNMLAKRGYGFGTYSAAVTARMQTMLPEHRDVVRHLPEVIAVTPAVGRSRSPSPNEVLLVSGLDSIGRRTPIRHLSALTAIPFRKVILHDPSGQFIGCDRLEQRHGSSVIFERVSTYFTTDFAVFLRKASAVLVAYDPSFINPSSILRHILCAAVPAISSRFPDSEFLVSKFGKIGELWNFDDIASLSAAMNRFINWSESDFAMLGEASSDLCSWANPAASASAHLDFAMHISSIAKRSEN